MHLIIQDLEVKCTLYKSLKDTKLKITPTSSGSMELYLTEIRSGSLMFVLCLVGVWQRNFEPAVCVCVCVYTVRRAGN